MKVYLAKSNKSNPNVVSWTRNRIQALGHEVIEYAGGEYNIDQIFEAGLVVVIVHPENQTMDNSKFIGRGVYSQVTSANGENIPAVVVRNSNEGETTVSVITKTETFDTKDWTYRWGVLHHDPIARPLSEILHFEFNSVDSLLLACNLK